MLVTNSCPTTGQRAYQVCRGGRGLAESYARRCVARKANLTSLLVCDVIFKDMASGRGAGGSNPSSSSSSSATAGSNFDGASDARHLETRHLEERHLEERRRGGRRRAMAAEVERRFVGEEHHCEVGWLVYIPRHFERPISYIVVLM